ncbi:MAG: ABC transporter substrate-binding protein [Chloroflexi bacterium]|nr:ABC transporter substrate-binding protein [Chloroflexota bacterium]
MFKKHNKRISKPNHVSRRDFLRFSGLTLASSMVPLHLSHTASRHLNNPSKSRILRQTNDLLRVAWEPPVTLDPANLSSDSEVALVNAIYDYLLDTDDQSQLVPRLAQTWEMSEDGTQYTLALVQNATFHDGSEFTADDVIWTFNRLRDPGISGAADLLGNIASIEAPDPYTIVFTLNNTEPDFLYNLTDNRTVIQKANTENPDTAFNGTGPFKMVEFDAEDRAVMERNENYWMDGAPTTQQLEFIYFGDTNASINALRDGAIDVVLRMPTRVYQTLQGDFKTIEIPTNGYNLARLRHDQGPGTDPRVWKAFKLATDRQRIFDIISAGYGALGNDTPIGPLYAQYFNPDAVPAERDPNEARQLLDAAGYEDGLDLTLHVPNSGDRPDLAQALRSFWQDANIRVDIRLRDEGIYYSDVEDNWLSVDLGITGWGSRPIPQLYLDLQLKSGARWNEAHYSNAELDQLIETAGTSLDQEVRVQAYMQIQELLVEEGPIIVPYFFPQFTAFQTQFDNIRLHPFAGRTDFRFVTTEE